MGGILPPGLAANARKATENFGRSLTNDAHSAGQEMPGSTAGKDACRYGGSVRHPCLTIG
jgi:hypothetical protein